MYRLFSRITGGLDPVATAFRKHVEADGMTLVRDAEAAAVAKKEAGALACILSGPLSWSHLEPWLSGSHCGQRILHFSAQRERSCWLTGHSASARNMRPQTGDQLSTRAFSSFWLDHPWFCIACAHAPAGKKKPVAGAGDDAEQSFVRQVVELHDKYRLVRETAAKWHRCELPVAIAARCHGVRTVDFRDFCIVCLLTRY